MSISCCQLLLLFVLFYTAGSNVVPEAESDKPAPPSAASAAGASPKLCPHDYRDRVDTCIMDAQVAPQAGGGLTLVIRNDTIVDLCDRGLLRKSIDCLEEIYARCSANITVVQELDRLFSLDNWLQGERVLCENSQLFLDNYDCMSKSGNSVMTCVLITTQTFRLGLYVTDPEDHVGVKQVTCSFAESVVKCVRGPLQDNCPADVVSTIGQSLSFFVPPVCLTDDYVTTTPPTLQPPSAVTTDSADVTVNVTET